MEKIRTYSELLTIDNFRDRFKYLMLSGSVGEETFGSKRYLNQVFYKSPEWRNIRDYVIARDLGCDLGMEGYELYEPPLIHHINPITDDDIRYRTRNLFDLENLITTSHMTHNAIHYGDDSLLVPEYSPRTPGDTTLW